MKIEQNLITTVLLGMIFGIVLLNSFLQMQLNSEISKFQGLAPLAETPLPTGTAGTTSTVSAQQAVAVDSVQAQEIIKKIMPVGVPPVYGPEMGISFDRPEEAIVAMSKYDGGWTSHANAIKFADLGEQEKQRYIKIGTSIACEFCCGAKTLITREGEAACGCAHSAAMRGLAKFLLKNHAAEFSDEQILQEVTKVKTLSFPKQMVERALALESEGQPVNSATQNLPSQVGGC